MKEVIQSFPVEAGSTSNLWDCDQYAVSLVVWKFLLGAGGWGLTPWSKALHGLSLVVHAGS